MKLTSTNQLPADEHELLNESARLLSQGRPGEAADKLLDLQKKHPDNVDIAINLGGAYILQRRWEAAAKVLKKALESHPDNAMLWTNLAAAELGVLETSGPQQQDRAIEAYQRALEIEPATPNVHYHLGLIYKERGELLRALAFFQGALDVLPTDRDAQHWIDRITVINERVEIDRARVAAEPESPATAADLEGTVDESA